MAPHPTNALHLFNGTRLRVIWNDLAARKVHDALVLAAKCDERLDFDTFVPVECLALQLLLQCMQGLTEICEGGHMSRRHVVHSCQQSAADVMQAYVAAHCHTQSAPASLHYSACKLATLAETHKVEAVI